MLLWEILGDLTQRILWIYTLAAVLPALFLLHYIYCQDRIEKEPLQLLLSLIVRGVLAALLAAELEGVGMFLLNRLTEGQNMDRHTFVALFAFLVVAVSEEGMKYLLMKHRTWNDPNFNYRFDGIVYAVFTSLGFAAYENILYVFRNGLSVALPRALLAVPGHMSFAVVMGVWYGRSKWLERKGHNVSASLSRKIGFLLSVSLHGFYDTCAMIGSQSSMIVFLVFVIAMFLSVFRIVRKESEKDGPIGETP